MYSKDIVFAVPNKELERKSCKRSFLSVPSPGGISERHPRMIWSLRSLILSTTSCLEAWRTVEVKVPEDVFSIRSFWSPWWRTTIRNSFANLFASLKPTGTVSSPVKLNPFHASQNVIESFNNVLAGMKWTKFHRNVCKHLLELFLGYATI